MKQPLHNEKGSAILIALMMLAMLTILGIAAIDRSTADVDLSYNQLHEDQSFYIAQAGVDHAIAELREDLEWRDGFEDQPFGVGNFTVTLVDHDIDSTLFDTIKIVSEGESHGSVSVLETWVVPGFDTSIFKYAVYGKDGVLVENRACTDSYNSDSGFAASQNPEGGDIGSDGCIEVKNNVVIGGNAATASDGCLSVTNHAEILGDTTTVAPPQEFPAIPDSVFDWAEANNSAPAGITGVYSASPTPNSITVDHHETISLASGVYFFDDILLRNQAQLVLDSGANVTIYVTGDILIENSSEINPGGNPSNLVIYSKGDSFDLQNGTEFRGLYYGWNTDWVHENHAQVYGSVVVKHAHIKNNVCVHYDRKLGSLGSVNGEVVVVAWREID